MSEILGRAVTRRNRDQFNIVHAWRDTCKTHTYRSTTKAWSDEDLQDMFA